VTPNTYRHPNAEALIPHVANIIGPLPDLVRRAREFSDIAESALDGERPDPVKPGRRSSTCCTVVAPSGWC
jgi:hypothetical protein